MPFYPLTEEAKPPRRRALRVGVQISSHGHTGRSTSWAIILVSKIQFSGSNSSGLFCIKSLKSLDSPSSIAIRSFHSDLEIPHNPCTLFGADFNEFLIFLLLLPKHQEADPLIERRSFSVMYSRGVGFRPMMEESTSGWGRKEERETSMTVLQSKSNHREIPRGPRSLGGIFIAILFPNSL